MSLRIFSTNSLTTDKVEKSLVLIICTIISEYLTQQKPNPVRAGFGSSLFKYDLRSLWSNQRSFQAHNRLYSGLELVQTMFRKWSDQRFFQAPNCLEVDLGLVWAMISQSRGQWSDLSDQTWYLSGNVWSERTLVWDGLIRGYSSLERSDQKSLPDGTSTWV